MLFLKLLMYDDKNRLDYLHFALFPQFDQSIYTVLPSKPNVSPSMVLVFELFILRGQATPTDQVVGWGIFPISDANFNIIEGK